MRKAKSRLDELFERLREAGFQTIEGDICCGNCATNDPRLTDGDGPGVYYTEQDIGDAPHQRGPMSFGELYLGYCVDKEAGRGAAKRAGERVVEVAREMGIETEWDGDPDRKILVRPAA